MTSPQSWNRYSYVQNNPVLYNDPTGHREELGNMGNQRGVDCKKYGQYCNGNKPKSLDELSKMRKPKQPKPPIADDDSDFFSEIAYFADNVGAVASDIEMIVVDTIGAIVIADGCATGVGCLPALGYAIAIDMGVSMYSPLGIVENVSGGVAAGATAISDLINGTTYVRLASDGGIDIGLGRDTVMSVVTGALGTVPEANFDAVVSNAQLEYDNRRRSGDLAAVSQFQLHIPAAPNLWGNGNGWHNGTPWK